MDSYRISKAWHISCEVAEEVQFLVVLLPRDGLVMRGLMEQLSATIPDVLTKSVDQKDKSVKLKFYIHASQSANQLLHHLGKVRELNYVEEEYYQALAAKVIEMEKQLNNVINKTKQEASAEHGIETWR